MEQRLGETNGGPEVYQTRDAGEDLRARGEVKDVILIGGVLEPLRRLWCKVALQSR